MIVTSALTEEGIPAAAEEIVKFVKSNPRPHSGVRLFAIEEKAPQTMPNRKRAKTQIIAMHGGGYRILHRQLENLAERCDFTQEESLARFTRMLRKYKVEELLEAAGAVSGDSVSIGYKEFNFYPDYYPEDDEEDTGYANGEGDIGPSDGDSQTASRLDA